MTRSGTSPRGAAQRGTTGRSGRIDPDELASLEEQRDHLLASIEDLEREFAAGDMDEVDYLALKDDYTVRAADVLEAIEEQRALVTAAPPRRSPMRTAAVWSAVLVFAVVAGALVARNAGQRGDGAITGATGNLRSELVRCQTLSRSDPAAAVECYDAILDDAPDNVEALTYQGWALIRDGDVERGAANLARAVELDPDAADPRVFRAIVAFRAGDVDGALEEIDRFYRNSPSPASISVLQSQGLERELFVASLGEATRACWLDAAEASEAAVGSADDPDAATPSTGDRGVFLESLGTCLDGVLAAAPDDGDALISRTYALLSGGGGDLSRGAALADRAVAADPDDPNARLMRASIAIADGRTDDAAADAAALDDLPRPTISFLIGGPEDLRASLGEAGAPTTTAGPERPAASTPSIPNPEGG